MMFKTNINQEVFYGKKDWGTFLIQLLESYFLDQSYAQSIYYPTFCSRRSLSAMRAINSLLVGLPLFLLTV